MNSPLTFGSVFAGIGGFDLGFERAGMSCTWQIENDPKANDILKTWWPDVRRHGDVRYSRAEKFRTGRNWEWFEWLRPVDLLAGGFPCQGISLAGRREGLADARSALFFEFLRIVDELHPRWVVIENVYGLLSSNGGRDMGTILGELEKLGFWWSYRVLDSQYFGVPQRRRRVFIVANSRERTGPFEVLFEPKSCSGHIAPGPAAGKRIAHTLTSRSRSAGGSLPGRGQEDDYNLIYPDQASTLMAKPASRGGDEGKTTAQTLRAGAEHSYQFVFKERGGYGVSSSRDVVPTWSMGLGA